MAGRCAFVTACLPWNGTGLRALDVCLRALPWMAQLQAMVPAAWEVPTAGTTARKTLQVTEDALAKLVFAVAVFRCKLRAWWAGVVAVTVVTDFVIASVVAGADFDARGRHRSAMDRRVNNFSSTVATKFFERNIGACGAIPTVTGVFASVLSAGQEFVAGQRAWMVNFNATDLATLVSSAAPFFVAPNVTSSIVGSS
jgi:hypothetical protein